MVAQAFLLATNAREVSSCACPSPCTVLSPVLASLWPCGELDKALIWLKPSLSLPD